MYGRLGFVFFEQQCPFHFAKMIRTKSNITKKFTLIYIAIIWESKLEGQNF